MYIIKTYVMPKCNIGQIYLIPISFVDDHVIDQDS